MGTLDDEPGVKLQFNIWNYAVTGDVGQICALIAEGHMLTESYMPVWDRDAISIINNKIAHGDEDYRPVKEWTALPWVGEHLIRGHEEWPGL